jgi:hypothetical protein
MTRRPRRSDRGSAGAQFALRIVDLEPRVGDVAEPILEVPFETSP